MADNANRDDQSKKLTRRRYAQAIVAASAAGVAGCNQGGDGSDGGGGNQTTTESDETETTTTTQAEPVSQKITSSINNNPEASNLNRWAASPSDTGIPWLRELVDPRIVSQAQKLVYSGTEMEVPHFPDRDTVPIPTMTVNLRSEPPFDRYWELNPELTYWDGTPLDAEAKLRNEAMHYYTDGQKFNEAATFNNEVVSQWEFHWWRNKGEVEGQEADPTNAQILDSDIPAQTPFHPGFTNPYYERYQDASNSDEVSQITTEVEGDNVTFGRFADEGWGSALYQVESSDDVSAESMTATLRDDHPNEHAKIPELELRFATADRRQVLKSQGEIDVGGGAVLESGGTTNREMLPDYIQEIDRYLDTGTDQIIFNWNNKHLARPGVRRAIVAAVDWETAAVNGWGSGRSLPMTVHTGLSRTLAKSYFSEEFLNSLYQWPMKADTERAAQFMEKAGYTKEGGVWTDWEGEAVDLNFITSAGIGDWTGFVQSVQQNLQDFGFRVGLSALEGSSYNNALKPGNLNYDMAIEWGPGATEVYQMYWSQGYWWIETLIGGDPNDSTPYTVDAETTGPDTTHDTVDMKGKPLEVEIPADPKNIEATPERAGANPSLSGETVSIDLADLVHSFRDPDITEEQFRKNAQLCARYYNFHLPVFKFHQYTWGLWGNVRDFKFAPRGNEINRLAHEFSPDDTQVLAGIMQPKYDEEYEQP